MLRGRVCFLVALLITCIALTAGTLAQTLAWSDFAGNSGDTYYASATDSSGNLYLAGRASSSLVLNKINSSGTTQTRTVFGSGYFPVAEDIRVDSSGNVYIVGYSNPGFPTTGSAFLKTITGGDHAFVAVVNSAGTMTYGSYLADTNGAGTTGGDQAYAVAVDSSSPPKVYVTGYTTSLKFPTTAGVYQTTNTNGSTTAFVAKFDPSKSGAASLVYSTYLSGPTSASQENGIAVDGSGNAYVTGNAGSDFPTTAGTLNYNGEAVGYGGVYVTKLNSGATALSYSAYLGPGTANGIAVDGAGNAYVAGDVGAYDFPTTAGAYQVTFPAGFASEVNPTGTQLVYSTLLGGPSANNGNFIVTDIALAPGCASACNAFLTGYTGTNDLSLTNPIQNFNASDLNNSGGDNVFIIELNGTGKAAVYATYLGGSGSDSTESSAHSPSVSADSGGDAFVVGQTGSADFPVTTGVFAATNHYNFASKIGAAAGTLALVYPTSLAFSTQQPVGVASTQQSVTLRNMGSSTLAISSISATPSVYTEPNNCGSSMAGGSECTVSITFTPTSATSFPGSLNVNGAKMASLTGTGVAQPFLTLSPTSLTFGDQSVGTASPSQQVTVGNSAATTLTFGNPPFSSSSPVFAQTNNCPGSLAQNKSCTVNIAFLPTQAGNVTGQYMQVSSNTSPLVPATYVNLAGTGIVGTPTLTLSTSGLNFKPQVVGTSSVGQYAYVYNTGNVPVTIYGVGANALDYAVSGCVQTLNPGGYCNAYVTFTPTTTGTRTATITLTDSTAQGTHTFSATGTGLAPSLTLAFDPPAMQLPDTAVGATSPYQTIQIINTGNYKLAVNRIFSMGDFHLYGNSGCVTTQLQIGQACNINVEFSPTATGSRSGSIVIEGNFAPSPQSVTLSGNGIAAAVAAAASPASINFGTQAVSTTSPTIVTVELINTGNVPLTSMTVAIKGSNPGDFGFNYQGCAPTVQSPLKPGTFCQVQMTFTPSATGGRSATLNFTDPAGAQTVNLAGTGGAAPSTGAVLLESVINFPPTTLTQSSAVQSIQFANIGSSAINITSVALQGAEKGDFSINSTSCPNPGNLAAHSTCYVYVLFAPTASGARSATLQIAYTGATGSPATATLNGTGVTASQALEADPAKLTFPPQVITTASPFNPNVVVTNTGTAPVTINSVVSGGSNPGDFSVSNGCGGTLNSVLQSPYSYSCTINVGFTPTATGARSATITIKDSASATATVINLSGTGVAQTKTLVVTPPTLTFNPQVTGTTSNQQNITVTNTGNYTVTFTKAVTVSSGYALPTTCSGGLPPNSACTIGVTFTPSKTGTTLGTVTITDDATGSPQSVSLTGTGISSTQAILLSQTSLTFDEQTVGAQSSGQLLYYYNQGNTTVTINSITAPSAEFPESGCGSPPNQIGAGQYCVFQLYFKPSAAGTRSSSMTINDTASGSPRKITLSGFAVSSNAPEVNLTPGSLTFASQFLGTTSPAQNINFTNNGQATLTGIAISLTGANTGDYAQTNTCSSTLPAGFSCNIAVTFTPTVTGTRTASVNVADNASGNPQQVPLTGTGKPGAAVTLSPTSLSFPGVPLNTKSPLPVKVTNTGVGPLNVTTILVTGTVPSDFTESDNCVSGSPVAPGNFCTITVTFDPSTTEDQTGTLTINDNTANTPQLVSITASGAEPAVFLSPTTLAFPSTTVGTTSVPMIVTMENYGNATLTISSVVPAAPFLVSANTCGSSLTPGSTCQISVEFKPTATGAVAVDLVITDNAGDSPQTVELTGTGK